MIRGARLVLLAWGCAGAGAVVGSIPGNAFGERGLFAGAVAGGVVGTVGAVRLGARLRLLPRDLARGAAIGGLIGFAAAAYLAVQNLHTPVIPILASSLPGLGALLGARRLAGREDATFSTEAAMNSGSRTAAAGFVLLLPAIILVSTGLLGLDRPEAVVHPVLVVGGVAAAFVLNALSVLRVRFGRDDDGVVGTIALRVHGSALNLAVLAMGGVLFAVITAYL
ncbi:MAG TPA: hypothetical protein VFR37_05230, partial [Longimicrobium sp.]|nr:hypothetical protein [Longimicrobium sp.]